MNVIIHIGYPKAASTWLQKSVFQSVVNFELCEGSLVADHLLKPGSFSFDPETCRKVFDSAFQRPVLISEERFLGSFNLGWNNGAYVKELTGRLKKVFPQATVIVLIRKQTEIIASAYSQYIRDGGTVSIDKFLYPPDNFTFQNILKFSFEQLEYHRIIGYLNALFPGKVRVYLFEEIQEDPDGFIRRLAEDSGMVINHDKISYEPRNIRYSRFVLTLARYMNIFTRNGSLNKYYLVHLPGFHAFSKRFWKLCSRSGLFGKPAESLKILGRKNHDRILSYYMESNRGLAEYVPLELLTKYDYPL
jgi:hypothetical protein